MTTHPSAEAEAEMLPEQIAERIAHCTCGTAVGYPHSKFCFVELRPAVASALQALRDEKAELIGECIELNTKLTLAEAEAALVEAARKRMTALEAEVQTLRDALEPFAAHAERYEPDEGDDAYDAWGSSFTIGDLRKARAAWTKGKT